MKTTTAIATPEKPRLKKYHLHYDGTDRTALHLFNRLSDRVMCLGGTISVSRSFGHLAPVIVMELPEDQKMPDELKDLKWEEVTETRATHHEQ